MPGPEGSPARWTGRARQVSGARLRPARRTVDGAETMSDVALHQAIALHQAGRLDEAEPIYRAVLAAEPRNFNALHLLGVVRHHRGQPDEAVELIEAALRLDPVSPMRMAISATRSGRSAGSTRRRRAIAAGFASRP